MATVYRETYTKPLPASAILFVRSGERFAKWTDRRGRNRTAKVITPAKGKHAGTDRITLECGTHTARYRNGAGLVVKRGTGCRTKDAAETVLSDLRSRAELVKANVMTPAQDAAADHAAVPIAGHFDAYRDHLIAKGCSTHRVVMVRARLQRLADECPFGRLPDMNAAALERWLVLKASEGLSASTRNGYREAGVGFGNWCRRTHRLIANPFADVPLSNVKSDRRHLRRALTESELQRLLTVAAVRPIADFGRLATKTEANADNPKRCNWTRAALTFDNIAEAERLGRAAIAKRPEFIAELKHRGRERALIYKTLVMTGLRKSELASLTVGQLELDAAHPYAVLEAADEKNREGSDIQLRLDLAADLRAWLADKLAALQSAARLKFGEPMPMRLPASTPLFNVPGGLIRIMDRDIAAAGIAKRDERGRVVDIHALRTTFGTHLSKAGVSLRTAQAAMRHSKPELTANIYTDPKLLDVAGAVAALPMLSLDTKPQPERQKATGTADAAPIAYQEPARTLVPTLVPNLGKRSISGSIADNGTNGATMTSGGDESTLSAGNVDKKTPLTFPVNGVQESGRRGSNPRHSCSFPREIRMFPLRAHQKRHHHFSRRWLPMLICGRCWTHGRRCPRRLRRAFWRW